MRMMDELHLEDPTRGQRRMVLELKDLDLRVGRDRVRSLMRRMRLCCVYRRPRTTVIDTTKYKHPYLLRGLDVERPHQVWAIDITNPHARRLHVPVRDHRPVQPVHRGLEREQHHGGGMGVRRGA